MAHCLRSNVQLVSVTTGGTRKRYDNSIKCEWNATNLNKGVL